MLTALPLASVILKEENPFMSTSEIVKISDDWLLNELEGFIIS